MTVHEFDAFTFNKQPGFDEAATREALSKALPLRTVVVYCFDPRAVGIPEAVAREFSDVWPGEIQTDAQGNKVGSTTTLFPVVVAGGRAIDALRSVMTAQHLVGIKRVVVVHHTHCGATAVTADGIINAFKDEHGADVAALYPRDSICISDYVSSLGHDTRLLRQSPGTPPHADIYGYVYNIDTGALTQVVSDVASSGDFQ
jgi:carbonic anhydrase